MTATIDQNQNLVSADDLTRLIRTLFRSRIVIGLCLASWVFTVIFAPGARLDAMSLPLRALYNGAWALAFYTIGYGALGRTLRWALARGLPIIWVTVGFFAIIAAIETIVFEAFFAPDPSLADGAWYWLTTLVMIVISVTAVVSYFEDKLRRQVSSKPELVPVWRRVRPFDCKLEADLPAEIRAPIRRVEARNQYVQVYTQKGDALLRMTLTSAEACLDRAAGMRVHRSLWIAIPEISKLVFRDGNPRIIDKNGDEYPISRKAVKPIRSLLNEAR